MARAWYPLFFSPSSDDNGQQQHQQQHQQRRRRGGLFRSLRRLRLLPLEPCLILALCLLGINGELWLGHESFRTLHRSDGYLFQMHLAEWQHTVREERERGKEGGRGFLFSKREERERKR